MSSGEINTQAIHDYLQPTIDALSPAGVKKMATLVAKKMQHNNSKRIKQNVDPDGTAFSPRKLQQRQPKTGPMMPKLFRLKHLQRKVTPEGLNIGFFGRSSHVADVHHFGLRDHVNQTHEADYIARPLLGITDEDSNEVLEIVLKQLEAAIQ